MNVAATDPAEPVSATTVNGAVSRLKAQVIFDARLQKWMGVSAGVLVLAFLVAVYLPGSSRLVRMELDINSGLNQLGSDRRRVRHLPNTRQAASELEARLAMFKPLAAEAGLGGFLREANMHASRLGLSDFRYDPQDEIVAASHRVVPVMFTFKAGYMEAFAFIRQIEQLPRLLRVAELNIVAVMTDPMARAKGVVSVTMTVHLFHRSQTPGRGGAQ